MSDDVLSTVLGMLTKEQKEELAAKLIADVGNLQPEDQKEQVIKPDSSPRKAAEDFTMHKDKEESKLGRRQAVQWQGNQFKDTGENRDESFNPDEYKRTPRAAPRNIKVTKVCSVCNRDFEISQSLVYGKFLRCDRCAG